MSAIERFDAEIKTIYKVHKDRFIPNSLPDTGTQITPRLFAAIDSNLDHFNSCEELQKYASVTPVT